MDPLSLSLFCGWQLGNLKDDLPFSGYTTQLGVVNRQFEVDERDTHFFEHAASPLVGEVSQHGE